MAGFSRRERWYWAGTGQVEGEPALELCVTPACPLQNLQVPRASKRLNSLWGGRMLTCLPVQPLVTYRGTNTVWLCGAGCRISIYTLRSVIPKEITLPALPNPQGLLRWSNSILMMIAELTWHLTPSSTVFANIQPLGEPKHFGISEKYSFP